MAACFLAIGAVTVVPVAITGTASGTATEHGDPQTPQSAGISDTDVLATSPVFATQSAISVHTDTVPAETETVSRVVEVERADATESQPSVSANESVDDVAVASAISSADLEIEEATSGDSDSETVSFSFRVGGNSSTSTTVSVSPSRTSRSYGNVEFEFVGWADESGGGSGSSTRWTATGGHRYEVTYELSASDGANEGSYSETATASTGRGNEYSERLTADVEVREPEFEQPSETTRDIIFDESTGSRVSVSTQIDVGNDGDGIMILDSMSVGYTPTGISASLSDIPDRIGATSSESVDVDLEVDDSVSEGDHEFTVSARDNLGNRATYDVTVRVEKLAAIDSETSVVNLGDVLVGKSTVKSFTLSESAGYEDVSDILVTFSERDGRGNLAFGGIGSATIPAGESLSQDVTVKVNDGVEQGAGLRWSVEFAPNSNPSGSSRVVYTANVIYPPYYDGLSLGGTDFVFDTPTSQVSSYTDTVTMEVTNGGDLPMDVEGIDTTVDESEIEATVVDGPETIGARSSETIDVRIEAGTDATEGSHTLTATVESAEAGVETETSSVTVDRRATLAVADSNVSVGEIIVTKRASTSTVISEDLGYEAVRDYSFEQVSGPDNGWLTVVESPSGIEPGESGDLVVAVTFDPSATLYETYTWTFEVSGSNVETKTVSVSAVPRPIDFSQVREDLTDVDNDIDGSDEMVTEMDTSLGSLEAKLRDGNAPRSDIVALTTAGRSTTIFLESADETQSALDAENYSAAQLHLTRTSAAFRTLSVYTDRISNEELAEQAAGVTERADAILQSLTERQLDYYQQRLEAEETTMLERARIKRDLSRLAALRGDTDRAEQLRSEADNAFTNYSTLVAEGNERLEAGRSQRDDLDDSLFVSVLGQRFFWIGSVDRFEAETQATLEEYDEAQTQFNTAGATERATLAGDERAALASTYDQAQTLSFGLGAFLGLLFLVVLAIESRGVYRYIQESKAAVTGDFLV